MPVDSWTRQQHHEYAYDTCCLLSRLMCLMRVLSLVVQQSSSTVFFGTLVLVLHSSTTAVPGTCAGTTQHFCIFRHIFAADIRYYYSCTRHIAIDISAKYDR